MLSFHWSASDLVVTGFPKSGLIAFIFHRHENCFPSHKVKSWRTFFTFSGLATSFVLGLLPSLWDSVSDFNYAEEEKNTTKPDGQVNSHPTYFFISLPLHAIVATALQGILIKCCSQMLQSVGARIFCFLSGDEAERSKEIRQRCNLGCLKMIFKTKFGHRLSLDSIALPSPYS